MTDHSLDMIPGTDEPPGGWQTSPTLRTNELLSIVLCKYAGTQVPLDEPCQARERHLHPDEECRATYYSAEALERGEIVLEMTASEVTASPNGHVTFHDPLEVKDGD